jgi:hypothetical protein
VKDHIRKYLNEIGAYYFMPVVTAWGKKGIDFHCCIRGWHVGIEAKAPGKTPTPLQHATMQAMRDAGGIAFWADNVETVKENIRWLLTHGSPRG